MAPKKKAKKHEQELEEETMAEWLSRGHAIKDFTMEKMLGTIGERVIGFVSVETHGSWWV